MPKRNGRTVRREIRLTKAEDRVIRRAAALNGWTMSTFLRYAARQAAAIELARSTPASPRRRRRG